MPDDHKKRASAQTILITGFGPFPGVDENVSEPLVRAIEVTGATRLAPDRVIAAILPTQWQAAPVCVAALINEHAPWVVVHFGVAEGATGLQIETQAVNACLMRCDAVGRSPLSSVLNTTGAAVLQATIPVDQIYERLRHGTVPVSLSSDAGGYLCNAILYHSLQLSLEMAHPLGRVMKVGFVHVPVTFDPAAFNLEDAVSTCITLLEICLDTRSDPVTSSAPPIQALT